MYSSTRAGPISTKIFRGSGGANLDGTFGYARVAPDGAAGTPAEPLSFALGAVRPNPAPRGLLSVEFVLPSAEPARLELIDIGGRRVTEHEVGTLGPGRHRVELSSGRRLRPGLYLVRLEQSGQVRVTRATVLD